VCMGILVRWGNCDWVRVFVGGGNFASVREFKRECFW